MQPPSGIKTDTPPTDFAQTARRYEQQSAWWERLQTGRFYTPQPVCDFMLALITSVQMPQRILEPACGAGAFLNRAAAFLSATHRENTTTLLGIDLDPTAADLAEAMLQQEFPDIASQIWRQNFLLSDVAELQTVDCVIGNPPYVRQETIQQTEPEELLNPVKKNLEYLNWSNYFAPLFPEYLAHCPDAKAVFSSKADLYQWFFVQACRVLQPGGTLAFITSNSWLETTYGQQLQHFLQYHFHWLYLVESTCERWFADAAINPIIIVLQKKRHTNEPSDQPLQALRFKVPLTDWLPNTQHPGYWPQLHQQIQQANQDMALGYRIFAADTLPLITQRTGWNMALRAPEVLLSLLRIETLWQPLEAIGAVRYPIKTGINQFFYLKPAQIETWQIEPEFLFPVLRSARKLTRLTLNETDCQEFLFSCPDTKSELLATQKTGALRYIEWAETQQASIRQKRQNTVLWPEVASVKNNRPWHYVKPLPTAHLLCHRFLDQRYFFPLCEGQWMEDQTFYGVTIHHPDQHAPKLVAGLLNSTIAYALLEFKGRASLGEGVLQFARCDMAEFPILNPAQYTPDEQQAIANAFEALCALPVEKWENCWRHPLRTALDTAVLVPILKNRALNLDAQTLRNELAEALLNRQQARRAMARSGQKRPPKALRHNVL